MQIQGGGKPLASALLLSGVVDANGFAVRRLDVTVDYPDDIKARV
jgi:hypothetical protein